MDLLVKLAGASGCMKSKRAVVLIAVDGGHHFGVNRPAVGECDGSETCRRDCPRICIHAEQEAVINAGQHARAASVFHLKVVNGAPAASGDPSCVECSKLMLEAGVDHVWLYQADGWRRWSAADFHLATLRTLELHGGA